MVHYVLQSPAAFKKEMGEMSIWAKLSLYMLIQWALNRSFRAVLISPSTA